MLKVNGYKLLVLIEHMLFMTVLSATAFIMETATTHGSEALPWAAKHGPVTNTN